MKTLLLCLLLVAASANAADIGVRIRLGLKDQEETKWDGTVTVAPGRVTLIGGWRFIGPDHADGVHGWVTSTRPVANYNRSNNAQKAGKPVAKKAVPMNDNGVLITFSGVTEQSRVQIKTLKGDFDFTFSEIPYGAVVEKMGGAVEIERTAAAEKLTTERTEDDYPAAVVAPDGTAYVAYVSFTPGIDRDERVRRWDTEPKDLSFLNKLPGGDQIWLRAQKDGKWGAPVAVTPGKGDIYKCALAMDGAGGAWIFWGENKNWPAKPDANFEIYARSFKDGKMSEPVNLSNNAASDVNPAVATDSQGHIWLAWQAARGNVFQIVERHQTADGWSDERAVSTQTRDCWAPAIAANFHDPNPRADRVAGANEPLVAIAWDTYDKGDYDVWMREFSLRDGSPLPARPVANSPDYEANPALTYNKDGALWISWEQSGPTWGKDYGVQVLNKGIGLYTDREIGLAVWKDGKWMEPSEGFASALPGARPRKGVHNLSVPPMETISAAHRATQAVLTKKNSSFNNLARIATDSVGNVWLFARTRQDEFNFRDRIGSVWLDWAAYYDGKKWTGPILLPYSDNLLYNKPAVVALPAGGLLVAHSSDHRQSNIIESGRGSDDVFAAKGDPFDNDIYVSRFELPPGTPVGAELKAAQHPPTNHVEPSEATKKEIADIARCRAQSINVGGKDLHLIRGEFHRHTEISGDGGEDGTLEDMWRYAIDVADMDWLGCGDHDNGSDREYPWWLTQKTTDAFRLPGRFEPPFTYERSVRYPEGHRNVVFAQRGVRTLPRVPTTEEEPFVHAPDTQMLYRYLRLFDGVCASHTSATGMGTDWRDNDPKVEPMVEIYQGATRNYERPGAPRAPSASNAVGGFKPKGFVSLALLKGYRLAFESSSDHRSTHISYAMVYADNNSREALLKAMKLRHTYAATANIVADFRCGDHMMGDEFASSTPPKLTVKLVGGAPFAKVTLVKDDVEIPLGASDKAQFEATWTDPSPTPGKTSYYYVRGEQSDGELVWASPMWITYQPAK